MRGEHNFPAAENFAHINITKWFGGKTVEKLKNQKESRYLLSTVYSYKKSTVSIASSPQSFVSSA